MNAVTLRARNFRSYAHLDFALPLGLSALIGANGSGKSSLAEVLAVALFGPRHGRTLEPYLTLGGEDGVEATVEFAHGGERYRVRRSWRNGKSALDFERSVFDESAATARSGEPIEWREGDIVSTNLWPAWRPLTRESAPATQAEIERVLGLTEATFLASSFLRQGASGVFCEADPCQRKAILCDALGLQIFDRLAEWAKGHRKTVETSLARLAGEADAARSVTATRDETEEWLLRADGDVRAARTAVSAAEQTLADVTGRYEAAREAQAKRQAAEAELRAAEAELRRLQHERDGLVAQAQAEYHMARGSQAAAVHDLRTLIAKREHNGDKIANVTRRIDAMATTEAPTCFACGQEVEDEAKKQVALTLAAELRGHLEISTDLDRRIEEIRPEAETELREPTEAALLAAVPEELRVQIGLREAALETARQTLQVQAPPTTDALTRELTTARINQHAAQTTLGKATTAKALAEAELARITEAETRLADLADREADAQRELDLYLRFEKACGRDGIPLLIVENALPQLEAEANRILTELPTASGDTFRLRLDTQRPTKTGDHLRDVLDIIVEEPNGEREYLTFSGGERARLSIALRLALARLLAHRRGAESRVLILDELDNLDEQGMIDLVGVLRGLAGDFDSIVCISHHPSLRDAFDNAILVEKDDGGSRIVGAETREAVPA